MSQERHRLTEWVPVYPETWEGWEHCWRSAENLWFRLSLLHYAWEMNLGLESQAKRAVFFLELADGHDSRNHFEVSDECSSVAPLLRQRVAQQAMKGLLLHFFTDTRENKYGGTPSWFLVATHELVLPKLIHFLRPSAFGGGFENGLYVDGDKRHLREEIVRNFVCKLRDISWKTSPVYDRDFPEVSEGVWWRLFWVRAELIPILYRFRALDVFLEADKFRLDWSSLLALWKLVMQTEHSLPGDGYEKVTRYPVSLDEAVVHIPHPARLLQFLLTRSKVRRRYRRQAWARQQLEQAQAALERLQPK